MIFSKASKVSSGPASEPLTLTEAKTWLKIESDITEDDSLITALISSARSEIEQTTGIAFFTQTIEDVIDEWPEKTSDNSHRTFYLLRFPVQSVSSVTYVDSDGVEQTLNTSLYHVDLHSNACGISLTGTLPAIKDQPNAIKVTYVAGWSAVGSIPKDLTTAMQLMMTYQYEKRADSVKRYATAAENIIRKRYTHII